MNGYFTTLTDRLTIEEIEVLNILSSNFVNSRFSAWKKRDLFENSNVSEANFRKIIYRLEAVNFVEIVAGNKEHLIYINEYGLEAINSIYERRSI